MTTVINTPGNTDNSGGAVALIVGVLLLLVVAGLFFVYVLPEIRNGGAPADNSIDVNVKLPESSSAPQQ